MNATPPETPKERKRRKGRERQDRCRKMKRDGFVFIGTRVQKETLDDLKQLFGEEDAGDALDMLLTVIRRSENIRAGIRDYRQESKVVTRDRIARKQGLQYPMDSIRDRMMKE